MRTILGEINIEGAMVIGDELVLLNRGVTGRSDNAATRYPLRNLLDAIEAKRSNVAPTSIRRYGREAIDGAGLGFTDGTALLDGSWVFSAVAENRDDSFADGPCNGSAVGVVTARGDLLTIHRLAKPAKIEGIDVRVDANGMTLCIVTGSDDPAQSSSLLPAHL